MGSTRALTQLVIVVAATLVAGCAVQSSGSDGGMDAGATDAGGGVDAGSVIDSGGSTDSSATSSCTADFGGAPGCGNGVCDVTETCLTCTADCGCCGDAGTVDGAGVPVCGNRSCETGETCTTCPDDCGACH